MDPFENRQEKARKMNRLQTLVTKMEDREASLREVNEVSNLIAEVGIVPGPDFTQRLKDIGYENLREAYTDMVRYHRLDRTIRRRYIKLVSYLADMALKTQLSYIVDLNNYHQSLRK